MIVVDMLFVFAALAAGIGIVLAALDSPHIRDKRWLERSSAVLLAVTAASVAAVAGRVVLSWIV